MKKFLFAYFAVGTVAMLFALKSSSISAVEKVLNMHLLVVSIAAVWLVITFALDQRKAWLDRLEREDYNRILHRPNTIEELASTNRWERDRVIIAILERHVKDKEVPAWLRVELERELEREFNERN